MLIGIFELLATKQQEYDAYQGYLEAVRDYWLARAALTRAVGNALPSSANIGDDRLDVDEVIQPQRSGKHSEHDMQEPKEMQDEHSGYGTQHDSDGGAR